MKCIIVLCIVAAASIADAAMEREECLRKMHFPHLHHCCKAMMPSKKDDMEDLKECFTKPPPSKPDCSAAICVAKKHGISDDDGNIDMKALEKYVESMFEDQPKVIDSIKAECINKDVSEYGPPDACNVMKVEGCLHAQLLMACEEWTDGMQCKAVQELVENCKPLFGKS